MVPVPGLRERRWCRPLLGRYWRRGIRRGFVCGLSVGIGVMVLAGEGVESAAGVLPDPPVAVAFLPVRLFPVPASVVRACRRVQAQASFTVLCPSVLPHASLGLIGWPPPALGARVTSDFASRAVAGVDISYGAPYEGSGWRAHRWRNRPCCFFHFDVFRRAAGRRFIPAGAQSTTLGGHRGLLVKGSEGAFFGSGMYFGNHVRFLWSQDGIAYVASLHSFGEQATEQLLGRLIANLRPTRSLAVPRSHGARVGVTPSVITSGGGALWVAALGDASSQNRGTFYRIDPRTGRIAALAHPGAQPVSVAITPQADWVVANGGLTRLAPESGARVARIDTGRFARAVTTGAESVWVVTADPWSGPGYLLHIDPATNTIRGRLRVGPAPEAVSFGAGSVWIADSLDGTVTRVDPRTMQPTASIPISKGPTQLLASQSAVWVIESGSGTILRIDPSTNRVSIRVHPGGALRSPALGANALWIVDTSAARLVRLDLRSLHLTSSPISDPLAVGVYGSTVWVTSNTDGTIRKVAA